MMNFHGALSWAETHPVEVGAGVFGIGLVFLWLTGAFGGSSASSSSDGGAVAAYFAAESAQAQAGDQLQEYQIAANASTAQTLNTNATNEDIQSTWAATSLSENATNDATAVSVAPYQAETSIAGDLAAAAAAAVPTTSTSTSSNSGFFGIGASKSTTTTTKANPAAIAAINELGSLTSDFIPGH